MKKALSGPSATRFRSQIVYVAPFSIEEQCAHASLPVPARARRDDSRGMSASSQPRSERQGGAEVAEPGLLRRSSVPLRGALLESRYRLRNLRQTIRSRPGPFALAAIGVVAALCLGASQFMDFSGVAVGAPEYEGDVGAPAPIPESAKDTAGSAHFFVLLPAAVLALVLIGFAFAGRWRLGGAVALVGLVGIVVSLAVDLPQGLDKGTAGVAYQGAEARLLTGFWLQLASSVVLAASGLLLGRYVRREGGGTE